MRLYWISFGTWGGQWTGITGNWERIYLTRRKPLKVEPGGQLVGEVTIGPEGAFITSRWTPFIRTCGPAVRQIRDVWR